MANPEKIKELIAQLKETLAQERENIEDMEQLVKQKVEREAGIWEYSYDELEKELFERFPSLEAKSDCLTFEDIPSPRRRVGALFTFFKRIVRKLTNPYTRMILAKQAEFDKDCHALNNAENGGMNDGHNERITPRWHEIMG